MENQELFLKQSIISTIILLAEKIRGRKSVSNLIQYQYDNMIKLNLIDLEKIRDGHLKAYNDINKDFNEWMEDNVVTMDDKCGNKYYATQDANYRNKLYGMNNLLMYYKKEFLITEKN
jgi:hypothetical protein